MEISRDELSRLRSAFQRLEIFARQRNYKGYDPYDVLSGTIPFRKFGKWPPILAIQLFKRNPINLRKWAGVPKAYNPKALGLFLQGYSRLPGSAENEARCRMLFEKLMELCSPGVAGCAWGYPFPWASPEKFLPAWYPTSVVSGFVAQGLDAYYRKYRDEEALQALEQVCVFLSEELHHTERENFYAISYSTLKPDFCYNASLLAAQTYALAYAHNGRTDYADIGRKAMHTVISRQKSNGSWNYSESLQTGRPRVQIDFHQGFILDSILSISECLGHCPEEVERTLHSGFEFYAEEQFTDDGRALWRMPRNYPADIHHQAQGILTALRHFKYNGNRRAFHLANSVLNFTIENFQDSKGYFYYRKHKYFTDRTAYMRWANAWMFLAMAEAQEVFADTVDKRDPASEMKREKPAVS